MDTTDDNFFIAEPTKLVNSFFNKDKSKQIVELLLSEKHYESENHSDKLSQLDRIHRSLFRHQKNHLKQQLQEPRMTKPQQLHQTLLLQHQKSMPKSCIERLEFLCQATYNNDNGNVEDLSVASSAVDLLISASKSGCCFLEKYIVMLTNFLIATSSYLKTDDNEHMNIKCNELLNRVLSVDFDRQQMTENLRRPDYRLSSVDHVVQLLQRVQVLLDHNASSAIDWLSSLIDAHFVELSKSSEARDIMDNLSAQIISKCALLNGVCSTKNLVDSVLTRIEVGGNTQKRDISKSTIITNQIRITPKYSIERIEF